MKKSNIRLTKILCVAGALVLVIGSMTACGKKKKISYGDTKGVVTGSVDINDNGVKFNLDNVIAPAGSDIDYTSGIKTSGETDDYSLEVNATNVRNDKPGTYTANYTVKSGGSTYTDSIKVTISDNGKKTQEAENQGISGLENGQSGNSDTNAGDINSGSNSGNNGGNVSDNNGSAVNNGGGNNSGSNGAGSGNTSNNGNASNNNGSSNSGNNSNSGSNGGSQTKPTGPKELITDGSKTYGVSKIPNATIELLSGDVVTISCSTNKYIISTRTDESTVQKNGHNYKVTKLIVLFNTGAEQTLETVEKKID
ncbi:MAG: hypothetical protein SPL51_07955 [Lachnospiraceae bacterium]|nr:hypothetical protein [Lachnospiraceae bacterium]